MNCAYSRYTENFPEEFSIRHKITESTEKKNFHLHKQLEIVFALSSNLKCKFEDGMVEIPQNGMILLNPMDLHYIYSEKGSGICDRYVLYFSPNYISGMSTPEVNLLECFLLRQDSHPVVLPVLPELLCEFSCLLHRMETYEHSDDTPFGKSLHIKFLLGRFLLLTNQLYFQLFGMETSPSYQNHSQLVYDIYSYIQNHYADSLNTDEIAKRFLVSKTQLYNIFKEVTDTTVSDYISRYRITKAKDFLINSEQSVELISQAVGYGNISSFSRVFKNQTGHSPIQYRKKHTAASD